jgi:FixJ family two-component response regulator
VSAEPVVFVVDDDPSIRRGLRRLIKSVGLDVETFASAQDFLEYKAEDRAACLVLDVRMPGKSGLDLQEELSVAGWEIPVIFITGHGDIPMTVKAMKAGAIDFLPKPFSEQDLLDAIHRAIQHDAEARKNRAEVAEIQRRVNTLTPREHEVFNHVIKGMLNKQIAFELGISEKTIKVHRARVMQKMQVVSVAELVRLAEKVSLHTTKG